MALKVNFNKLKDLKIENWDGNAKSHVIKDFEALPEGGSISIICTECKTESLITIDPGNRIDELVVKCYKCPS